MPPKKGKNTKRVSEGDEDNTPVIDVQYNPEIITGLTQELGQRVDARCNHIQTETDFMVLQMQQQFQIELLRLPNEVKKMSITKFKKEFGDSLEMVPRDTGRLRQALSVVPSTNQNNSTAAVFQTPAGKDMLKPARAPKEGENIQSSNGSPLGEFTTVQKAPRNPMESIVPQTPGVFVPLRSGEIIDIENVNVENLDPSAKEDALEKMKIMMANMQKLMGRFQS